MKSLGFIKALKHKLHKIEKYAFFILTLAILLILLKALIFPNTIDILVAILLFILLIALVEDEL